MTIWNKLLPFFVSGFLTCFSHPIRAETTSAIFAKYPNIYFIETGSYHGDGIQKALDAGFPQIFSIEVAPRYVEHCHKRFANNNRVTLLLGDSTNVLPQLLTQISSPATFWLDGHYSWGTARGDLNSPILEELEAIRQHPIKTHTILIDDIRLLGTIDFDFLELDDIIKKLLEINPHYKIHFENGFIPNDVLVATP